MIETQLPRLQFAHLPTPVEPLPRLGAELGGPQFWIKRDDQTGLAFGGNKTRKLEYLLAEARAHGARTLITMGAVQSNHCRQTAAAAARFGFNCTLVLAGTEPKDKNGNLLLDTLLGADIVWAEHQDAKALLKATFDQAWADGRRPYLIPYGGSNPTGAAAYVHAMAEFLGQDTPVDVIVLATSSGGTQAGMLLGARASGFQGRVLGISVDKPAPELRHWIADLASQTADLIRHPLRFDPQDVEVIDSYVGEGYAIIGDLEREAIDLFARLEGILLDPVYTGRAAGGMIDLVRQGEITEGNRVLFWHTGGMPALFAYAGELNTP